jgi:hypothetical protein
MQTNFCGTNSEIRLIHTGDVNFDPGIQTSRPELRHALAFIIITAPGLAAIERIKRIVRIAARIETRRKPGPRAHAGAHHLPVSNWSIPY